MSDGRVDGQQQPRLHSGGRMIGFSLLWYLVVLVILTALSLRSFCGDMCGRPIMLLGFLALGVPALMVSLTISVTVLAHLTQQARLAARGRRPIGPDAWSDFRLATRVTAIAIAVGAVIYVASYALMESA